MTVRDADERWREPRFGVCPPADGSLAPFRVLVSLRWLLAGLLSSGLGLATFLAAPRRWRLGVAGAFGMLGMSGLASALLGARRARIERMTLPIDDLPPALDGVRIVQISDLHLGWPFTMANARRAVAWTQQQPPQLIALTGDFVAFARCIDQVGPALQGLRATHGVVAVFGNHDYWVDTERIATQLADLGVTVLRNESRRIAINGAALRLIGVDCVWEARHDIMRAMAERQPDEVAIVLAHEPDIADKVAALGAHVQLSGHTHAGHFALPVLGPAFLPRHGFRYYRGLQRVGRMWLYVSRGIGGYPLRLGCPPEITELTLQRATGAGQRRAVQAG